MEPAGHLDGPADYEAYPAAVGGAQPMAELARWETG